MGRFFCAACVFALVLISPRLGQANEPIIDRHTLEISVGHAVTQGTLLDEAEGQVRQLIVDTFAQQPEVSEIEVVVLGDRYGEISPILITTVSRSQWQANPQVNRWTRYYTEGTHALLQRHGDIEPTVTAAAPPLFIQNVLVPVNSPGPVPLIRQPAAPSANARPGREPLPITSESQVTQDNLPDWD